MPSKKELLEAISENPELAILASLLGGFGGPGQRKAYNPGVERTGDKITLPEGASIPQVIGALQRQHEREEQVTEIHVTIPVSPWDGATALVKAIERELGVVIQEGGFRGAQQMEVEVSLGKTVSVPWGRFELPGMDGATIATDTTEENGRVVFQCHVACKRRFEPRIQRLLKAVREIAAKESLHRGKAFSIAFHDEDDDQIPLPQPKFFAFSAEEPVFNDELTAAIQRNVCVPIEQSEHLRQMGESLKRGILFAGTYGVGKTLLASYIARVATKNGWTFIYVKDANELPEALRYAQQFQPVVVFAEDVDRIAGPSRTNEVNELLNQLDGVDGKAAQIMTIVTTNYPDRINPGMRRPGRIDLVLEVTPPDAPTVARMIKVFAKGTLERGIVLTAAAEILADETPARVRETVSRAKLEVLRRTADPSAKITAADLEAVAREVKKEQELFARTEAKAPDTSAEALAQGFEGAARAFRKTSTNGAEQLTAASRQ